MTHPTLFPAPATLPIRERFPAGTAVGDSIRRGDLVVAERNAKGRVVNASAEVSPDRSAPFAAVPRPDALEVSDADT